MKRPPIIIDDPCLLAKEGVNQRTIKHALAVSFYQNGTLSEKEACTFAKATRREFEEMILPKFGVAPSALEDIEDELDRIDARYQNESTKERI